MKVLIVNNMAPFIWGGAEELAENLRKNLVNAGHDSEVMRIPFKYNPATVIPSQMLMVRTLELDNADRVIALKFPAYLIRHAHKTLWLLHQYRQAYDLFESGHTNIPLNSLGDRLRQMIRNADNEAFSEAAGIYTNSEITQARLRKFNGVDSCVLLPPVNDPHLFIGGQSQGYIFAGGRINKMKRQHMLVEAMASASPNVRLVVAGPPESAEDRLTLEKLVEKYALGSRVHLDLRFLSRTELANYVNNSSACAYLPYDEDSLGYVAMEAATAGKPIITTSDSGGILGLVKNGYTGWVTEPTPVALSEALTLATTQSQACRCEMGESAKMLWSEIGTTWPMIINRLLG